MKKDDFVTKDIELDIVSLGYNGILPVEVRLVSRWLHNKFPNNSAYREGYWLWREDLLEKTSEKYGFGDDDYYDRRNYIIRLVIDEIIKNISENKIENNNKNTKDVLDADINAMKIYLGLGYSVEDAKKAFYKVFEDKTGANKKRCETLQKFIKDYEIKK